MTKWQRVRLGDLTTQVRDAVKVADGVDYDLLGLRMYGGGVYLRETVDSTTSKAKTLFRARTGQFIYNRMFAWGGSFGVVPEDLDGSFVSNEFPIFDCHDDRLLTPFLRLHFQQSQIWEQVNEVSTGTTASRNRWKESLFAAHEIPLPSVDEQRRIVDVMAATDAQIDAMEAEAAAVRDLVSPLAEEVFDSLGGELVRLGDVLDVVRGGSPRPIDDYFTDSDDGLNWIKIGDVAPGGKYITTTAQKIRPDGLRKTRFVRSGSFLLSNSMSFGRPYILRIDGCIHDGWLSLTDGRGLFDQDYLYYLLRGTDVQGQFDKLAAGSGVRNLNIKAVKSVEVRLPSREAQSLAVMRLNELSSISEAYEAELAALRALRSTLLTSLLSQSVSIPASYDAALEQGLEGAS